MPLLHEIKDDNKMDNNSMDMIAFQIISNVGTAKSLLMEALYDAKEGKYQSAEEKMVEANTYFVEGHRYHSRLIQQEAAGKKTEFSILFMHAEDQLMTTELLSQLVTEMIDMYKKMDGIK